jgi:hypothetical protein
VNQIEPNENGDDWLFEIAFSPRDLARYEADGLELIEASGLEHEAEIALALETSAADASGIADAAERLAAESFSVEKRAHEIGGEQVFIELWPRDDPRDALRAFMERLGSPWLVEDDGWYANVTWMGEHFPIAEVEAARLFLRPWRDPRLRERLPGGPTD